MSHEILLSVIKNKDTVADRPYSLALKVDSPVSNTLEFESYWVPSFTYGFTEGAVVSSPTLISYNTLFGLKSYRINVPAGTTAIYFKLETPTNFLESSFRINQGTSTQTVREVDYWKTLPTAQLSMRGQTKLVKVPNKLFSNCRNMALMFFNCTAFNQPLDWDTSLVTSMDSTFYGCSSFNQPLDWNTANVTNMAAMFYGCRNFNQLLNFDTSNVTNMANMFYNCISFNQLLNFDTSNVTNMSNMFNNCSSFNQAVNFDTVNVTNMNNMFYGCSVFNQSVNFNTAKVTTMSNMFRNCSVFNQPVNFDPSNVTSMSSMFRSCIVFNQDMSSVNFKSTVIRTNYDTECPAWLTVNKPKFTA